jgi:predicted permease
MGLRARSTHVTVSVALVVALGVGANVAVVSILGEAIIGSSPYQDADALVVLENHGAYDLGIRKVEMPELSWPDFQDLTTQQQVFSALGGVTRADRTVWGTGARRRSTQRMYVTEHLFQTLAARAYIGRLLGETDFKPGALGAALVTVSLWRSQLGSDPHAVGRVVHVDALPFTVVGVVGDEMIGSLRERTTLFDRADDSQCLILPVVAGGGGRRERLMALRRQNRGLPMLTVVGRLKAGRSVHDAEQSVQLIAQRLAREYPGTNHGRSIEAVPLAEWRTRAVRYLEPVLRLVAALAWLAACASAAGFVLADAIRREPEMAVRHALGASRRTMVGLVLRRSLQWTVPGGLFGMVLAWVVVMWIAPGQGLDSIPVYVLQPAAVARAAALTVLAGLALAGIASWVLLRQDLTLGLKEVAQSALPGRRRRLLLQAVITFQMAAATTLGFVCALLIRSMVNIIDVELGFNPGQTFIVRVFFSDEEYQTAADQSAFLDKALRQLRALPDVASVGFSNTPPLSGAVVTSGGNYMLEVQGHAPEALGPLTTQYVSPGYFESIGMSLSRGRGFSTEDARAGSRVIIVDQAFCRGHLGSADPLAAGIRMDGALYHIVGVARDVRPDGPLGDVRATMYVLPDKTQPPQGLVHFVVRPFRRASPQLMGRVVDSLVGLDRRLVVDDPQMLETLLAGTLANRRRTLRILVLASAIVFTLTAFSISGALTEFVANKTRELALRAALGACWWDIALLLVTDVARPCIAGLVIGGVGGWLLARALSSELFGVAAGSPATMALTVACVLLVGLTAIARPLTRAGAIDPADVLRAL